MIEQDDVMVELGEDSAFAFAYGIHDPDNFRKVAKDAYADYFDGLYDENEDDEVGNLHKRVINDLTPVTHGYITAYWVDYHGFSQWEYDCTPNVLSGNSRPGTYIRFDRFEESQ